MVIIKPFNWVRSSIIRNDPAFWLDLNIDGDILSGEYGKEVFANYAKEGH